MKRALIVICLFGSSIGGIVLAEVPLSTEKDLATYQKLISKADVVHLGGAITVNRNVGYQVKWNSSELLRTKRKDFYRDRYLVGGINNSPATFTVVALIPLYEYRGAQNPGREIAYVKVNGKQAKSLLFSAGESSARAIRVAIGAFPDKKLLESQLSPTAPLLFIDAGAISPSGSLKIEYETLPRGPIKIN